MCIPFAYVLLAPLAFSEICVTIYWNHVAILILCLIFRRVIPVVSFCLSYLSFTCHSLLSFDQSFFIL